MLLRVMRHFFKAWLWKILNYVNNKYKIIIKIVAFSRWSSIC